MPRSSETSHDHQTLCSRVLSEKSLAILTSKLYRVTLAEQQTLWDR